MQTCLVCLALLAGTGAYADEFYTATCTAELINRSSGYVVTEYDKSRSGAVWDDARELAEEGVMEECAKEVLRFDLEDTHVCRFRACTRS